MASLRSQIIDAIVTRFGAVAGWTAVKKEGDVTPTNFPKLVIVEDVGESPDQSNAVDYVQKSLLLRVTLKVQSDAIGPGESPYELLDRACVELRKVINNDPANYGITAFEGPPIDLGDDDQPPVSDNEVARAWRLRCIYFHDWRDPEAGPA